MLSLGLGLALLVTVIEIDGNLRRQFLAALPGKAPSFYFVDIPAADAERFDAFVHARAPRRDARARADAARPHPGGERRPGREIKPPPDAAWVLQSDRGITYGDEMPAGSRVVAGEWWKPDYQGPPLVSFEKKIADGLGLKVGDPVTVNVLGRNIDGDRRQPAHARLAEPRHQFRDGVLAQQLPRRAAHPYRDADLSGRRHDASRRSRCSRRSPTPSRP